MAKIENTETTPTSVENVEQTLTKMEQWFENNRKPLIWTVVVIVVAALLYMAFQKFYIDNRSKEAAVQMFPAEQAFANGEYEKALSGDGMNLGFADIVSNYSLTKQANLSRYYAGISCLHLGKYDEAIDYLTKYSAEDDMTASLALGAIADAYAQKSDFASALNFYKKAADSKNELTAPIYLMRSVLLLEKDSKFEDALAICNTIKEKYPESQEATMIEKYIARLQQKK